MKNKYFQFNSHFSIFILNCDNILSAPYSVHKLHKSLPQNQFTPPKPFRKIILMTDDNFSIYNTISILGEIMIFFSINLSISLHTDFFPLWMREIEIMAMKMWLANHLLEYTKFSKPFSLLHHLIGTMSLFRNMRIILGFLLHLVNISHKKCPGLLTKDQKNSLEEKSKSEW